MKSGPQVLLAFWSVAVIFWSRVFFSARVALSLDGERAEPLANMLFGARQWTASSSVAAHQRCRVVKYCVAAELEDFDRDSRTDGLMYMAANLVHFRPLFLAFLRQSKTSL